MDYTVIRTRRRTAAIQVRPNGSVVVRCPLFLSDARIRQLVEARRDWIQAQQRRLAALPPPPTPEEEQILQRRGQAELPGRVAHWAERMGLFPQNIRITGAKKRLGSCSGKGNVCFSRHLMACPPEIIDAVIVHELAHLRHMNHSPAFYQLVETYLPDYRQRMERWKKGR